MLWAALITGLIGSLHCTGMCGPLICAMPIPKGSRSLEFMGMLVYNSGRIFSYAILGFILGSGGLVISAVAGKWYAIIAGAMLVLLGLYRLIFRKSETIQMPVFMRKWTSKLFKTKAAYALPLLGMLNGFIPCGAVYAALAGASVTASPTGGALYMLVFGLATWPALFSSYFLSGYFLKIFKSYYKPATALFLCLLGVLLIIRGVQTQLPSKNPTETAVCE